MVYKGIYHLFYQYNPNGAFWQPDIVWAHSTSTDLINWTPQPIALLPSEPYDINGCWSGSTTILPGDIPAILYTGFSNQKYEISDITSSQADVEISFKVPDLTYVEELDPTWTNPQILCSQKGTSVEGRLGPFGLLTLASIGLEEYTAIFFRIFKGPNKYVVLMCSDPSMSTLNPTTDKLSFGTFVDVDPINEDLSLRTLIDHSVVESFGANGKSCITTRIYPTLAINDKTKLYAFNYGAVDVNITKLNAWSMKKAQINLSKNLAYHNNEEHKDEL